MDFDFRVPISNFPLGKSTSSDPWEDFSNIFRGGHQPLPRAWADVFGPLRKGTVDDLVIVGQIGQSLDGRIATESGHSKYINGPAGLVNLLQLRGLVEAGFRGVGPAAPGDSQLTVPRGVGAPAPPSARGPQGLRGRRAPPRSAS